MAEPQKVKMVYEGEQPERPERVAPTDQGREQLPHWGAFTSNATTSKDMAVTIERWNAMRQRLLDLGEMKAK